MPSRGSISCVDTRRQTLSAAKGKDTTDRMLASDPPCCFTIVYAAKIVASLTAYIDKRAWLESNTQTGCPMLNVFRSNKKVAISAHLRVLARNTNTATAAN